MCDSTHELIIDAIENKLIDQALYRMKRHVLDFQNGLNATGVKFEGPVELNATN